MTREKWAKMTDEEKRIKVAELCDYVLDPEYADAVDPIWDNGMDRCHADQLPDYLDDLNAMHEAEKQMTSLQSGRYQMVLANILGPTIWNLMRATARQRAEAFVLTMEE